jgi:rhodanese-related sulfurtransferase
VRFDDRTEYVNVGGVKELSGNDLIQVDFEPGKPATQIKKITFDLPPGVEIDIRELVGIMRGGEPYTLVDARPCKRYPAGHIPSAICIFAKELEDNLDKLPADKSQLVVFYCGGPTCPYTRESIEIAQAAGYTNLKGFQAGLPGWKKAGQPVVSEPTWVEKGLDPHHVVIDTRPRGEAARRHIETAVSMPAQQFVDLTQQFIRERKEARLPGVADKKAPIILYGDTDYSRDVLTAYVELKKWKYKKVSILKGGFNQWVDAGRPVTSGDLATTIDYEKKLAKGAIPPKEFIQLVESRKDDAILVDVRSPEEIDGGTLQGPGTKAIPLDNLDQNLGELPKDHRIVAYCSNGIRAEMAYELLRKQGYPQVAFLNETLEIDKDGDYTLQ